MKTQIGFSYLVEIKKEKKLYERRRSGSVLVLVALVPGLATPFRIDFRTRRRDLCVTKLVGNLREAVRERKRRARASDRYRRRVVAVGGLFG
mgnify:CR=1 FL=1